MASSGYKVTEGAIEHDARKFADWKGEITKLDDPTRLVLVADDFSYIPGAQDVFQSYAVALAAVQDYVVQGADVFEGFARTLGTTALEYAKAEDGSAADVASLTQFLEDL